MPFTDTGNFPARNKEESCRVSQSGTVPDTPPPVPMLIRFLPPCHGPRAGKQRVLGSNPSSKPLHWLRNYTGELWTGPAQLKQILSFHASAFPLSSAFGEAFSAMTYSP